MALYSGDGTKLSTYLNGNKYHIEIEMFQYDIPVEGDLIESWNVSEDSTIDNVIADLYLYNGDYTLYIHGTGNMLKPIMSSQLPWFDYRPNIKKVIISDGVISTSAYLCDECSNLKFVRLSQNLTTISGFAFRKVNTLTSLYLPKKISRIGSYAFSGCTGLVSINIPLNVKHFGKESFNNCKKLQNINYEGSIEQWNSPDFSRAYDWYLSTGVDKTGNFTIYCTNGTIAKDGTITYYN